MRPSAVVTACLAVLAAGWFWSWYEPSNEAGPHSAEGGFELHGLLSGVTEEGFERAYEAREFRFPRDHGPHDGFRSEWWYFTGNLWTPQGRRFGYELTFFRMAVAAQAAHRPSAWATNQAYMAHFALTDPEQERFRFFERLSRGAMGLAGAQADPFRVWLDDWSVSSVDGTGFPWRLRAAQSGLQIDLELSTDKAPVLQGERGLSRKSAQPGNATYYYSLTRLDSRGTLNLDGEPLDVSGASWLDREWGTSALGESQIGWDWFALQLSDGRDLMFYRLRRGDGTTDPHSAGTVVGPRGGITRLAGPDVAIEVRDTWVSRRGVAYPSAWKLTVRPLSLELEIRPVMAAQELDVIVRYWEGAVDVTGTSGGADITGHGYVELTGYAEGDSGTKL